MTKACNKITTCKANQKGATSRRSKRDLQETEVSKDGHSKSFMDWGIYVNHSDVNLGFLFANLPPPGGLLRRSRQGGRVALGAGEWGITNPPAVAPVVDGPVGPARAGIRGSTRLGKGCGKASGWIIGAFWSSRGGGCIGLCRTLPAREEPVDPILGGQKIPPLGE